MPCASLELISLILTLHANFPPLSLRSPDNCGKYHCFPTFISQRREFVANSRSLLEGEGWWFHHLDDKLAGYVYASTSGYNPPQIIHAGGVLDGLDAFSGTPEAASDAGGFVIRATNLHSNKGIYVLPTGFGGIELIRGREMSLNDVKADLMSVGAAKVVVERYIQGPGGLPTEYKFHVFQVSHSACDDVSPPGPSLRCCISFLTNLSTALLLFHQGQIGSINILSGRGTCDGCWAEIDENGERLDQYG